MDTSFNKILLEILELIQYEDDREAFVNEFISLTSNQALIDLVQTLPSEIQSEVQNKLQLADTHEKAVAVIQMYFNNEQVNHALDEAVKNAITSWIKAIYETLSETQKEALTNLAKKHQQSTPQ